MNRRNFVASTAGTGLVSSVMPAAETKNAVIEMRWFRMRNMPASQVQRTQEFLGKEFVPAAQRAGAGTMGFFSIVIGEDSPAILAVISYPSFDGYGATIEKLGADKEFQAAFDAYNGSANLPYVRMESSLLRAFNSVPQIETPPTEAGKAPRVFELRTYESNTMKSLRTKIAMFDGGEVDLFRKTGLLPVFFGETIVGPKMPNLTYMVAFDDLAAREKNWRTFATSPEWKKLSSMPVYADADIVSNISNSIMRPLAFSQIK
ncbi:MAG TPA: NIPSNAP family protein [Bryobacteraceae bacterium]|nr:NIPSNAP family protein [Bryobacteraceae bacterium]